MVEVIIFSGLLICMFILIVAEIIWGISWLLKKRKKNFIFKKSSAFKKKHHFTNSNNYINGRSYGI